MMRAQHALVLVYIYMCIYMYGKFLQPFQWSWVVLWSWFTRLHYMLGVSCFPGGLPSSSTGRIVWQPSPGRTLSCPRTGNFEPEDTLILVEAPGVVQRLPGNTGSNVDQGDLIYLHHAFGATATLEGLWENQRTLPRNVLGGNPQWHRTSQVLFALQPICTSLMYIHVSISCMHIHM